MHQYTYPADRRLFLKIKIISLTEEARLIRKMERRNSRLRSELRNHRAGIVRDEARHTLLAYGFIRGRTLQQVGIGKVSTDWNKVRSMIRKYGDYRTAEKLDAWIAAGSILVDKTA